MKITFIGLGIMGSRMAANLLKNGADLTVYNRSKEPVQKLVANGAKTTDSAAEAVVDADVVFSMLSNPEVVEQVFFGGQGLLNHMKAETIWVDCSTVNPSFSLRSAKLAQANAIAFLDAPVAGTLPHAANAELVFFVGGAATILEKVDHLMNFMGRKVLHIGEHGKGSSFKMLVNAILAQNMVIFSEAVLLGEKMGLSKSFLLDTLPNLAVSAPFTKSKAEMIRSGNYEVQFPLELMHKDLHLAALSAYELNQPLFLVNLAKEMFAEAKKGGMGRLDFAAIHHFLEQR